MSQREVWLPGTCVPIGWFEVLKVLLGARVVCYKPYYHIWRWCYSINGGFEIVTMLGVVLGDLCTNILRMLNRVMKVRQRKRRLDQERQIQRLNTVRESKRCNIFIKQKLL